MKHALCAGLIALAGALPALAEDVSYFTLENGLEAVVIEDHRAPVVVHMVWYKAGAADERKGKSGIAHYLEHLMFKGTDDLAPGEFSKTVAANGGSDNAFTSYDYTAYFQRIAADRLEMVMKMEADRMRDLELSEDDWQTEREVILEERAQRTDSDPGALFGEQRNAAQYLNHPYGTPVIGWRHEMMELTREDALDWYRQNYAPNNAVLVVAGDVTPDEVRALAETYYGPLAPSENLPERARVQEPPQLAERRLIFEDPRVAQPYVTRGYLAPERDPGDQAKAAALTVLAEILGGNPATSVLGRKLVFGTGAAIYASAFYDGMSIDDTVFSLAVMPAADVSLPEVEAALDTALAEFLRDGVDPEQFERIKTQVRAADIYARDNTQGLARRYGEALASGFSVEDVQGWPEALDAVTEEDVMAAAREVFDRKRAVTGYLTRPAQEEVSQ
ncbi:M16 family metallopeptidase [Pseudothioclava nitratireducens]|uniref:M16 family metallopeptidase n=1 Tax=Pseudothioclava nitratireducens TaxID=1928646 RepID=UPI0023DBFE59|nr:pitrilysin family protein [Defluviimonas nitratireducens]MDF1620350.1 pitrilysin family protein [Defluviimonas nitratireducens]